jgi:hypothetical protein
MLAPVLLLEFSAFLLPASMQSVSASFFAHTADELQSGLVRADELAKTAAENKAATDEVNLQLVVNASADGVIVEQLERKRKRLMDTADVLVEQQAKNRRRLDKLAQCGALAAKHLEVVAADLEKERAAYAENMAEAERRFENLLQETRQLFAYISSRDIRARLREQQVCELNKLRTKALALLSASGHAQASALAVLVPADKEDIAAQVVREMRENLSKEFPSRMSEHGP